MPAFVLLLVEHLDLVGQGAKCDSLQWVLMSGDFIPLQLPQVLYKLAPWASQVSMGGATEASIWSNSYSIRPQQQQPWSTIPYGRAMSNQRMYILNDISESCPIGVTGNIVIGGVGVSEGYWNDAERTALSFQCDPESGERRYWTGDFGRWREIGEIEFLGRKDNQVKLNEHGWRFLGRS